MLKPIAAACGLALVSIPAVSSAETVTVLYEDLDLSSKSGQKELDRRIDTAAKEHCGSNQIRTGTRLKSTATKKCESDMRAAFDRHFAGILRDARKGG